ncbi:MAG: RNA polymerase sporulation sigma factor SigH [Clostridia bacterium]
MDSDKYDALPDDQIIALYKAGDEWAFEYLINKYKYLVRYKIRNNFLQGADKDDLLQEGIIGLYKAIRDYDTEKAASFKVFAELCITRQIHSAIKMSARQKHIPLNNYMSLSTPVNEDTDQPLYDAVDIGGYEDPMEKLINLETFAEFETNAMRELSKFELAVLNLYLNNFSYHRISELTGKSVKSVDNGLQRIKKKIEKLIKESEMS